MNILLREVTEKNFKECVDLKTAEDQQWFVAANVRSIAESKVMPYLIPAAIYNGDTMVGFALYGRDPQTGRYYVVRLMIDAAHQRRGYGRQAMRELIRLIGELPECSEIYLSYVPANLAAEQLYLGLGFEKTGEIDEDGEIIMRLVVGSGTP